jgi:hypothetical protein
MVNKQVISELPNCVQNWLINSGVLEKEIIKTVSLRQELQLKLKPGQKDWCHAEANQNFTIEPPAFNWTVKLRMNSFISLAGRDIFENGKGAMSIKLFYIIPLVNVKDNSKINQATLQRYLAEIVWFPSAVLSPFIMWEQIDNTTAKATMSYEGTTGSGTFYFKKNGDFEKFEAIRYKDTAENSKPILWTVTAIETEERNGIRIPTSLKADWKLEGGHWTWLNVKIKSIKYNVKNTDQ